MSPFTYGGLICLYFSDAGLLFLSFTDGGLFCLSFNNGGLQYMYGENVIGGVIVIVECGSSWVRIGTDPTKD
jgi:hypothetical protein